MLNIGPKSSGEVPEESIQRLKEIGEWLTINGDAIYGTKRWEVSHEGPTKINVEGTTARQLQGFSAVFSHEDFWFTAANKRIYAIALEAPENRKALIKSFKEIDSASITGVSILGTDQRPQWRKTDQGLEVDLPEILSSELGYVIALALR